DVVASLGLLGLISNKVVEKTKEIGIRKVLGAGAYRVAQILLGTMVKQIVFASGIGIPVAYYLVQRYLEKFSIRIGFTWWHYTIPMVLLMTILLVTISFTLWKAIKRNPVDSLRYE
ncbi:MAG: FtsX-like permease family protein, partial [Cyclobacteriaceae bacterium]